MDRPRSPHHHPKKQGQVEGDACPLPVSPSVTFDGYSPAQQGSGLDNAGKTTILKKLNNEDISGVSPTLGFMIKSLIRDGYTLNIWDVGGQTTLRPYWRNYFESTDAVVWVVDSSDRIRMGDCRRELEGLLHEERLAGATLLVFANKQDLDGSMSLEEIRDALALPSIISHRWIVHPCSAYTGTGLDAGLDWVVKEVAGRLYWSGLSVQGTTERIPERLAEGVVT